MSEGRTPTATLTELRRLEQEDVDILHQIVIRAQNDPIAQDQPKDALWQAYVEIFDERKLGHQHDRACFNVLLKLLNPSTPGESLYHKFENILQQEGIVLAYDDDVTTQDEPADQIYEDSDDTRDIIQPKRSPLRNISISRHRTARALKSPTNIVEINDEAYFDNTPLHIVQLFRHAEARDRLVLARQTVEAWKGALQVARDRHLEQRADALYELRLKRKALKQCIAVTQDLNDSQMQADRVYHHRLAKHALIRTSDEYRVRRMNYMDEDRMKALSLYRWTIAARESAFKRNKEWQTKKSFFEKLVDSYRARKANEAFLEGLLHQSNVRTQSSFLQSIVATLTQKRKIASDNGVQADNWNRISLFQASMNTWKSEVRKVADLSLTAEDAREYFLMKRVLRRLRSITQFRTERRTWLATWVLRKWSKFVKHRKHSRYDDAYREMRKTIKVNLARRLLHRWQQKLNDYNQNSAYADQTHQASVMKRINKPVVEMMYDTAEWVKKNEPVAERRSNQVLQQRAMLALRMQQQSLLDMSAKAERLQQYLIEQRGVQNLRQMQLKAFELQRRQYDADAFRDRHDKRAVRYMLARLRRMLAERRAGDEGLLDLVPPPAVTPARKREELLFHSTTRLSTTPAYTPFAMRLRQEPEVLEDIDDEDEEESGDLVNDTFNADVEIESQ